MEQIKPIDLVKRLNAEIGELEDITGDVDRRDFLLSEELWGLENGVYVPVGNLVLPVKVEFDNVFSNKEYMITLWRGLLFNK